MSQIILYFVTSCYWNYMINIYFLHLIPYCQLNHQSIKKLQPLVEKKDKIHVYTSKHFNGLLSLKCFIIVYSENTFESFTIIFVPSSQLEIAFSILVDENCSIFQWLYILCVCFMFDACRDIYSLCFEKSCKKLYQILYVNHGIMVMHNISCCIFDLYEAFYQVISRSYVNEA